MNRVYIDGGSPHFDYTQYASIFTCENYPQVSAALSDPSWLDDPASCVLENPMRTSTGRLSRI